MAEIKIRIPEGKVNDFLEAFIAAVPNKELDEEGNLKYNRRQWVKVWLMRELRQAYRIGKHQLIAKTIDFSSAEPDPDLVE